MYTDEIYIQVIYSSFLVFPLINRRGGARKGVAYVCSGGMIRIRKMLGKDKTGSGYFELPDLHYIDGYHEYICNIVHI